MTRKELLSAVTRTAEYGETIHNVIYIRFWPDQRKHKESGCGMFSVFLIVWDGVVYVPFVDVLAFECPVRMETDYRSRVTGVWAFTKGERFSVYAGDTLIAKEG